MKKLYHIQLENGTFWREGRWPNVVFDFYIISQDLGSAINIAMEDRDDRYYVVLAKELAPEGRCVMGPNLIL